MIEDILKLAGGLLIGAFLAAAVIHIVVSYLDIDTLLNELKSRRMKKAVVKKIATNQSVPHISLSALDEDEKEVEIDIEAEGYDQAEIYEGAEIYV